MNLKLTINNLKIWLIHFLVGATGIITSKIIDIVFNIESVDPKSNAYNYILDDNQFGFFEISSYFILSSGLMFIALAILLSHRESIIKKIPRSKLPGHYFKLVGLSVMVYAVFIMDTEAFYHQITLILEDRRILIFFFGAMTFNLGVIDIEKDNATFEDTSIIAPYMLTILYLLFTLSNYF
jgi:hypothetical protein